MSFCFTYSTLPPFLPSILYSLLPSFIPFFHPSIHPCSLMFPCCLSFFLSFLRLLPLSLFTFPPSLPPSLPLQRANVIHSGYSMPFLSFFLHSLFLSFSAILLSSFNSLPLYFLPFLHVHLLLFFSYSLPSLHFFSSCPLPSYMYSTLLLSIFPTCTPITSLLLFPPFLTLLFFLSPSFLHAQYSFTLHLHFSSTFYSLLPFLKQFAMSTRFE